MTREHKIRQIGLTIQEFYQSKEVSADLTETILYSVEAGGKRIRPLLLLELLEGFGLELTPAHFQVAAALEMIHTGSLIQEIWGGYGHFGGGFSLFGSLWFGGNGRAP